MKQIKFRGKRIDNGEWVYGRNIFCVYEDGCTEMVYTIVPSDTPYTADGNGNITTKPTIVLPETVGQFTGLHDKNGKEIYEGDVIQMPHSVQEGYELDENGNWKTSVVWNENRLCWTCGNGMGFGYAYGIEVIGNIYEVAK